MRPIRLIGNTSTSEGLPWAHWAHGARRAPRAHAAHRSHWGRRVHRARRAHASHTRPAEPQYNGRNPIQTALSLGTGQHADSATCTPWLVSSGIVRMSQAKPSFLTQAELPVPCWISDARFQHLNVLRMSQAKASFVRTSVVSQLLQEEVSSETAAGTLLWS